MKRTLISIAVVLFVLSLAVSKPKEIDISKLRGRDGLFYEVNTSKPFSGKAVAYYNNGQKAFEGTYKGGKYDGRCVYWYENGQKKLKKMYRGGKLDGTWNVWDENGKKKYELKYKDGQKLG